jgi:hypothetical protein
MDQMEDWLAFLVRMPVSEFTITLQLSETKHPLYQPRLVLYEPNSKVEHDVPNVGTVLVKSNNTLVLWTVPNPQLSHTYELQWKW